MTDSEFIEYSDVERYGRSVRTRRGPVLGLGPELTKADLDRCQEQLGCTLPSDYRRWLLLCNGGIPKWGQDESAYFTWTKDGDTLGDSVDAFFSVRGEEPRKDLVANNKERGQKFPSALIAIGTPSFMEQDRLLLLCVEGPDTGKVFDWRIAEAQVKAIMARKKTRKSATRVLFELAPSFEAFWDSLRPEHPSFS